MARQRSRRGPRFRAGPELGGAPISVAINFGFPLMGCGVAVLYAAFFSGGALLWVLGGLCVILGILAFGSGKNFT